MSDLHTRTAGASHAAEQWEQLARLYDDALALPVERREAYLEECAADPAIVQKVRALLASPTGHRVDRVIGAIAGEPQPAGDDRNVPSRAGPYEILREIGHGGMGVVYLARRADGAYQRLVALKVSRHARSDSTLTSRLLAERDILAGLAHPNIVPLFDAGITDDGRPYFTMEYVDGVPIDVHCDRHQLNLEARIRLFQRVCSAVAAAHRALVVHRDLKPTNVLVTADGEVKLLDFGIAKLLEHEVTSGVTTATEGRLMTPAYASPEQLRGGPVSVATDVYALGLLLYELLCGYRAHQFSSDGLAELVRVVVECDPPPMSVAATGGSPAEGLLPAEVARRRSTSPARLARALRGDLERIAGKALAKDADRRYGSVAHLAEDLERYLDGRPVEARGASRLYRARRLVGRHRVAATALGVTVLVLMGYAALSVQHARELAAAAERERLEARRSREVADFVVGLFETADPSVGSASSLPLSTMLDRGLARAEALSTQPLLQARLLNAIGRVYSNTGRFAEAASVAARALAISRAAAGPDHPDVARDLRLLGISMVDAGKPEEAVAHLREALAIHQRPGGSGEEAATDQHHLAYALARSRQADEAEPIARASLAANRALRPPDHEEIAASLSTLAYVRRRQGHPGEAAQAYREALGMVERRLGARHPEVPRTRQNLAAMLIDIGDYEQAATQLNQAIDEYRQVYGERHPSIATTLNNLGRLELLRNRHQAGIARLREALEMRREMLGAEHPMTLLVHANLAAALGAAGRFAEGEEALRDILVRTSDLGGDSGLARHNTLSNLANVLRQQGKLVEAEKVGREALELAQARQIDALEASSIRGTLGQVLLARGDAAGAVAMLEPAVAIRRERLGPAHDRTRALERELEAARRQLVEGARR